MLILALFISEEKGFKLHSDLLLSYILSNIHCFEILLFQDQNRYLRMSPCPGPDSGLQ